MKDNNVILEVKDLHKSFGEQEVLKGISTEVNRGDVIAIIGPSGCGKSTFLRSLNLLETPTSGQILFEGTDLTDKSTDINVTRQKIGMVFQQFNLFANMTIKANIMLAPVKLGVMTKDEASKKADELLTRIGLLDKADAYPAQLSGGQKQRVAIIRSLAMNPDVILFDEPTSALTSREIDELFNIIRKLKSQGCGIVYISHRLEELAHITDRVTIMRDGHYITEGNFTDFTMDEIIANMVGREIKEKFPHVECKRGKKVFEVKNLNAGRLVRDINFSLYEGEIVGFAGLMGAGRTETTRAIFGVDPKESGTLILDGKEITINNPMDAIKAGVVLAPEDRKKDGLCTKLSIRHNIALPNLDLICGKGGVINTKIEEELCDKAVADLTIKTPNLDVDAGTLSGGNQQKVVVGKWLARNSRVVIFDEPTRGIDVGAKVEIYQLMNQLKKQGIAVMFVSSEMPEVMGVADRIIVMCDGRITGEVMAKETTQNDILKYATSFENKLGSQSQNNKEE